MRKTECTGQSFLFHGLGKREIVARFDGGDITSDAGGLLLRETEHATATMSRFATCFRDHRDPRYVEHSVAELVSQRVIGLCLGYADLNDHAHLRNAPLFAPPAGTVDPTGSTRRMKRDEGSALAGKSTLNRLELGGDELKDGERYKKITLNTDAVDDLFVDLFVDAYPEGRESIIIDLDATDVPLHGKQEGRFFHGYYDSHCYLPLYIFCDEHLLGARLRKADRDASAGSIEEVSRIVEKIRASWPNVEIMLRADSGFARESLMKWCEANDLRYVFGMAKNARLLGMIEPEMDVARDVHLASGEPERIFADLEYQTQTSWSRKRRVIAKAEHLSRGANPRFVVTNIPVDDQDARQLYEDVYCARGEMENRIKEQQLGLFADRLSTSWMKSNALRLYFSSIAYTLMQALRRIGLAGTPAQKWQCGTIRTRLLKIGAEIRVTVRKIWVAMSSGCPYARLFASAHERLSQAPPLLPVT